MDQRTALNFTSQNDRGAKFSKNEVGRVKPLEIRNRNRTALNFTSQNDRGAKFSKNEVGRVKPLEIRNHKPQQKGDEKRTVNGHGCDILQTPDSFGRFGKFGGRYVPETVLFALADLELAFNALSSDLDFQKELDGLLKDYVGRESPLYFAERLSEHYKRPNGEGPLIYLKREDLNHTGAHKINNAVAQALLAKRLGKERIIAETGAGKSNLYWDIHIEGCYIRSHKGLGDKCGNNLLHNGICGRATSLSNDGTRVSFGNW
ncbi:hypothetical protein ACET3Z_021546 [Daucus carota]